jgi:hypothetical protein
MGTITYEFVELGEGLAGEYDPADPHDIELLRLDVCDDGDEIESLCTLLPVATTDDERQRALDLVATFAATYDVTAETLTEVFSHMDPTWIEPGGCAVPHSILTLFGLES